MSVAMRRTHIISCDGPGCQRTVRSSYNLDTAQAQAMHRGWQVSYHPDWDGGLDFCAEHKTPEEGHHYGDDPTNGVRAAL